VKKKGKWGIIINFICRHKYKRDCDITEYNIVKYVEQDRQAQKCFYFGPKQHTRARV